MIDLSGGQVVEDVLTSGLSAKLMRFLRLRVLGEASTNQKDASHISESKSASAATCVRGREEVRSRVRQILDTPHVDSLRVNDLRDSDDTVEGEPPNSLTGGVDMIDADSWEKCHNRDLRDGKVKSDVDESGRDDSSRRKPCRLNSRIRGKGRLNEALSENEQALTAPGSGSRSGQGRSYRDRNMMTIVDTKRAQDTRKCIGNINHDGLSVEREDTDDCFQECKIGTRDITDVVKKAVRAAEAEARAANAPTEAIRAAGDAAAEVVKSAALEVPKYMLCYVCWF